MFRGRAKFPKVNEGEKSQSETSVGIYSAGANTSKQAELQEIIKTSLLGLVFFLPPQLRRLGAKWDQII